MMYLLGLGVTAAGALCTLTYTSNAGRLIKASALAISLLFGAVAYDIYVDNLGAPIIGVPHGDFLYVHHTISPDGQIYLWALHIEERQHRLYSFEYSREVAEELQEAQEQSGSGKKLIGNFSGDQPAGLVIRDGTGSFGQELK